MEDPIETKLASAYPGLAQFRRSSPLTTRLIPATGATTGRGKRETGDYLTDASLIFWREEYSATKRWLPSP
jgi:hypothetical protein